MFDHKAYRAKWNEEHPNYQKEYWEENKDTLTKRNTKWKKNHKRYCKAYRKQYYQEHAEYYRAYQKAYREKKKQNNTLSD